MKGQGNGHEGPALRGIGNPDRSLVGLHDFPGEGQADAHPAFPFREERFTKTGEGLGAESGSGVADGQLHTFFTGLDAGHDLTTVRHGLAGVDDEVADDLFDPELVAGDQGGVARLDFEV